MRKGRKPEFIYTPVEVVKTENGQRGKAKLWAINLGSDYCAEHEWGIKKLKDLFGISDVISVYGMKRRKVSRVPKNFCWIGNDKQGGFVVSHWFARTPESFFTEECARGELMGTGLRTAWSESDFAAVSDNPADIEKLQEIFEAFQKKNIIICYSKVMFPAFENPGLCFVIANRVPKELLKEWEQADKDAHQLQKDFDKTGIERLLREKGCKYFVLSPRREEDGSLRFWLNPYEQDHNNFGWYRLEDLQAWAEGKGPIPKTQAEIEKRLAR